MQITVIDQDGVSHQIDAIEDWRVMELIKDAELPIKAECGGACSCATCHVFVDPPWSDRLVDPTDEELDMLDTAPDVDPTRSRLSCQILMREDLDGLVVTLAPGSEPED